jgi:hypothetical protein
MIIVIAVLAMGTCDNFRHVIEWSREPTQLNMLPVSLGFQNLKGLGD